MEIAAIIIGVVGVVWFSCLVIASLYYSLKYHQDDALEQIIAGWILRWKWRR